MNLRMRKLQISMLASIVLGASALFGGGLAQAESGVTIGNVHIEPAFGAPTKPNSGPATSETEIVAEQGLSPMLTPNSDSLLQTAEGRYANIEADGGFPRVPRGTYKKGAKGDAVKLLNLRLFMEGYLRIEGTQGQFASLFTTATEDSVKRYQRNLGLAVTGKVDAATIAELNVSASDRLATIRANIPRLAVYEQDLGSRYLVVNVPAQQIETVSDGQVYSRHNAIVGRPERPSPVVMTPLSMVKFNPYWNAPVSIVENDIIPKLRSGTQILNDLEIKVFKGIGGPEVDPRSVDWSRAIADDYAFRQEPGPKNAMNTAKIEFTSPFGIYLHDTSEPGLFKTANRFYSSGCIRVDKMPFMLQWVLNGQDGFGEAKIATMAETLEQLEVPLQDPPQLRVAYLTAWPAAKNTVAFRRDVYDLDGSGFIVGQPMPVGELSPDGARFVLKPLPRQVPVEAAEAEGFGLFHFGKSKSNPNSPFKKGLFGKPLLTASAIQDSQKATNFGSKPSPAKTTVKGKKNLGFFDWISYREGEAAVKNSSKVKKPKKDAKAKLTRKKKVLLQDASISPDDIPPEPKIDVPNKPASKKPAAKTVVKPASCSPASNGKLPTGCKAPVNATVDATKAKPKA